MDLGVTIALYLKWKMQLFKVAKRATLYFISFAKAFTVCRLKPLKLSIKAMFAQCFGHAVMAWFPYFQKDIDLLERVQRRTTKIPTSLRLLSYEKRLIALKLLMLVHRRATDDLIE